MKFLLADVLIYNDEDGTLTWANAPEGESQLLTCTANAILRLLVQHHGGVVEREDFLREVWDERGLRGSSNSLNQYVSILRKTLGLLLPDTQAIVTVPKTGFMLSADLPVQRMAPAPAAPLAPSVSDRPQTTTRRPALLFCLLLTLIVVLLCARTVMQPQTSQLQLLTHIGDCPVYTFTPLADVFRAPAIRIARQIQQDGQLSCLQNSVFYLHIQDALFYGDGGRLVLSQCSRTQGRASTCRTLYYFGWQP